MNRSGAGRPIFLLLFSEKIIKNKKKYTLKTPLFYLNITYFLQKFIKKINLSWVKHIISYEFSQAFSQVYSYVIITQ